MDQDPSDSQSGDAANSNGSEAINNLLRQALEQLRVRQPPAAPAAAANPANPTPNDVTASLLHLLLSNGNALPLPQQPPLDNNAILALLLQQPQQQPNHGMVAASLVGATTNNNEELRAANLQAQALLKEQEDALRETRLLLQQQIERMNEPAPPAAAAAAAAPGDQSVGSDEDEEDDRKPAAVEDKSDDENSEEGRNVEAIYDDDELDDDAYFAGFDKEDSHKVNNETFPFRLYRMLYEVEKAGKQDVASFSMDGKMFCVRKPKRFVDEIMPEYFTTSRVASFQRQLNLYGFNRISEGAQRGSYYHPYFRKGKRALCRKIKRQRTRPKPASAANGNSANTNANSTNTTAATAIAAPSPPVASLPAAAAAVGQQNSLSFVDTLPMSGVNSNLNTLVFNNPGAAAELLQRATAGIDSAALASLSIRDLNLRDLLESSPSRQGLGTIPHVAAPSNADEDLERVLGEKLEAIKTRNKDKHNPVSQQDIESGDIDLF